MNAAFQQWGFFSKHLSIDEMIVKYGHNRLKQFIQAKPIRFGYKLWALCSSDGYCYKFDVYMGKETNDDSGLSLGSKVVTSLLDGAQDLNNHTVFFEKFFTSRDLLIHLKNLGCRATGTMRENRTDKCPLQASKVLAKSERGNFDYRFDKNGKILIVKWNDNKCVCLGTNFDTIEPLAKASRWSKVKKQKLTIPQPNLVKNYNTYMGGVDQHDWLVGKYCINIRGKKVVLAASYTYDRYGNYKCLGFIQKDPWEKHNLLFRFQKSCATSYLKMGSGLSKQMYRVHRVVPDVRYDGLNHWIQKRPQQRRCQYPQCTRKPLTFCVKYDVTLCVECFQPYHCK